MLNALQARARRAGAVEQTVLCTTSGGGCAERPLYAAVSEEPVRGLVWLALGPVRQLVVSGKLVARGPAFSAC